MKHVFLVACMGLMLSGCGDPIITNPTGSPASQGTVVTLPDGTTAIAPATPPVVAAPKLPEKQIFLDNGQVKLGIDLGSGGAITYLAEKGGDNMINNHDLGRQIQTSLYAGPIIYIAHGKMPLGSHLYSGWNPNQAGNYVPEPSPIVSWQKIDDTHLYVKTIPLFYAYVRETADCVMENWIELSGNTANVRFRVTVQRDDTTHYYPRPQEAPGIYTNAPWSNMVTYLGGKPFTNDAVKTKRYTDTEYETLNATENWVALVNDAGRGLGLWQDNHYRFNSVFFGKSYNGGQLDGQTAYIGGADFVHLEHNSVWEYEFTVITGTVADIRRFAYQKPRPLALPNYRFTTDRQRWYTYAVSDQNYPVRGELSMVFGNNTNTVVNDRILSPFTLFHTADMPKIYIQAAFTSKSTTAQFGWRTPTDPDLMPQPDRYVNFPIIGDGQYRTYEINLSGANGWTGDIVQIGIKAPAADPNTRLRLRSVTTTPP